MPYGVVVQLPGGERRYGETDGGGWDQSGISRRASRDAADEGVPPLRDLFMLSRTSVRSRFAKPASLLCFTSWWSDGRPRPSPTDSSYALSRCFFHHGPSTPRGARITA